MPQESLSGADPYLSAEAFFDFRDARPVLELLADDDVVPSLADALDGTKDPGRRLLSALKAASGEVEEFAAVGGRYVPDDLAALAGNAAERLRGLVADLAFWRLAKRRWPRTRVEEISGAAEAQEALERLAAGETLFPFAGAVAATQPAIAPMNAPGDERRTVTAAARFFGNRRTE